MNYESTIGSQAAGRDPRRRLTPLASGTQLGTYEIMDALGAGGMGDVYRERDLRLRRERRWGFGARGLEDAVHGDRDIS
jgi:hypothetical protein